MISLGISLHIMSLRGTLLRATVRLHYGAAHNKIITFRVYLNTLRVLTRLDEQRIDTKTSSSRTLIYQPYLNLVKPD